MAGFYFLLFFFFTYLNISESVLCPFNENCECKGFDSTSKVIKYALCKDVGDVKFEGSPGTYSITGELRIETPWTGCTISAGAFSPFNTINRLTVAMRGPGQQVWRYNAFDGVKVTTFAMVGFVRNVYPLVDSVRNLGGRGLQTLEINDGQANLTRDFLMGFPNLQSLTLNNTEIVNVADNAFSEVTTTLTKLSIRASGLKMYPRAAISQLKSLQILDISNNENMPINEQGVFSGLENLRELNVSVRNSWVRLNASIFQNLPPRLSTVYADKVLLVDIPPGLLQSPQIKRLSMSASALDLIIRNGTFPVNHDLTELILDDNKIDEVYTGSMSNLTGVQVLSMKRTIVSSSMDLAAFSGMTSLTTLKFEQSWYNKGVTVSNINQVPSTLTHLSITDSVMYKMDSTLRDVVERSNFQTLDLAGTIIINCTQDMNWMPRRVFCPPVRILVENTYCGFREEWPMVQFLRDLVKNPCS